MPLKTEKLNELKRADKAALCEATEEAIRDGLGFNWTTSPAREVLESYWRGVIVVPNRELFVGRLDGVIAGAIQLVKPTASKQSQAFRARISNHFVAPWARGHGMAVQLLDDAEDDAKRHGFRAITLEVRETQDRAIEIYESHGYKKWGELPYYEMINGRMVAGFYYAKTLER